MRSAGQHSLVVGISGLVLVACVNVEIAPREFPYEAMISATDLGPGWQVEHTSYPRVDGALSSYGLTIRYGDSTDATQPFLAHRLTIYPDAGSATAGYMSLREEFNLDRPSDPIIDLRPQSADDLEDSHGERIAMNGLPRISCIWIQQHHTQVTLVNGLLDGQEVTLEEFRQLVGLLDSRLNKLDLNQPRSNFKQDRSRMGVGG